MKKPSQEVESPAGPNRSIGEINQHGVHRGGQGLVQVAFVPTPRFELQIGSSLACSSSSFLRRTRSAMSLSMSPLGIKVSTTLSTFLS